MSDTSEGDALITAEVVERAYVAFVLALGQGKSENGSMRAALSAVLPALIRQAREDEGEREKLSLALDAFRAILEPETSEETAKLIASDIMAAIRARKEPTP